jgi:hypothetical protein
MLLTTNVWLFVAGAIAFVIVKAYLVYSSRKRRRVTAPAVLSAAVQAERARLLQAVKSVRFQETAVPLMRFWCTAPRRSAVLFVSDESETMSDDDGAVWLRMELVLDLGLERHLRQRGLTRLLGSTQRALTSVNAARELVVVAAARSNATLLRTGAATQQQSSPAYACTVVVPIAAAAAAAAGGAGMEFDSFIVGPIKM